MKEYTITKVDKKPVDWETIPKAEIDTYGWMDNGYAPRVLAALCYDEEAIYVKFWAHESEVRGVNKNHQEPVYEDSCVEFFFQPVSSPYFVNIETNVVGAQLIGFGKERDGREEVPVLDDVMKIEPSVTDAESYQGDVWTLSYRVPFSFIKKYYGDIDVVADGLRANLYKCGDLTKYEHYGMWNPVENPEPDFHKPEFFGRMTFEK